MPSSHPALRATALALIAFAACSRPAAPTAGGPPGPPTVDVARPVVRDVTEWDDYTGRIAAVDAVEIRPRVSGYLLKVHFVEGQLVQPGDPLFTIDPRPFQAVLAAAEAELAGAKARAELARADAERAARLVESKAISTEQFDTRATGAASAQAAVEAAAARVAAARLDLEFTEVRAPVAGRVGNFRVTVGNLVVGGPVGATLLTTVVSLDPIHCWFDISERDYLKYTRLAAAGTRASSREQANPVRIALGDEADFARDGVVDFVDNAMDGATGTMRGRARLPNPDGKLVPGLFARVRLLGETRRAAVLVPDAAIVADQSLRLVYVVGAGDRIEPRPVVLGRVLDGMRLIQQGLDGSERVVVNGLQRVRPGATVAPHVVDLAAPAGAGGR